MFWLGWRATLWVVDVAGMALLLFLMAHASGRLLKYVVFDWGDTLMSESGPQEISMADWPTVQVIEGAQSVLAELALRYTLAVATNATVSKRSDIARALKRAALADSIGEIFCYTEIGSKKDDPRFWQIVLQRLGAHADEVLMVGDSLEQDVYGPKKAGIRAIWFNWKREPRPSNDDITEILRLDELPSLLAKHSDARHAR